MMTPLFLLPQTRTTECHLAPQQQPLINLLEVPRENSQITHQPPRYQDNRQVIPGDPLKGRLIPNLLEPAQTKINHLHISKISIPNMGNMVMQDNQGRISNTGDTNSLVLLANQAIPRNQYIPHSLGHTDNQEHMGNQEFKDLAPRDNLGVLDNQICHKHNSSVLHLVHKPVPHLVRNSVATYLQPQLHKFVGEAAQALVLRNVLPSVAGIRDGTSFPKKNIE